MAFVMFWEILWALCLGFFISAVVQAVVSKRQVAELLGDDRPKTIATACGLGAASTSCSYAAVAIARSLFRKGPSFTAAMAPIQPTDETTWVVSVSFRNSES